VVSTTIVILGILIAIAVIIFLALLERWRVDAATRQLVGDLRRAYSSATNELTDWRVVLALDRTEQEEGPDYYLVRLTEPYDPGDPGPVVTKRLPRSFPGNVKVTNVIRRRVRWWAIRARTTGSLPGARRPLLPFPRRARSSSTPTGR